MGPVGVVHRLGRLFAQEPFPEWFVPWFVAGTFVFLAVVIIWAVRQRRR